MEPTEPRNTTNEANNGASKPQQSKKASRLWSLGIALAIAVAFQINSWALQVQHWDAIKHTVEGRMAAHIGYEVGSVLFPAGLIYGAIRGALRIAKRLGFKGL